MTQPLKEKSDYTYTKIAEGMYFCELDDMNTICVKNSDPASEKLLYWSEITGETIIQTSVSETDYLHLKVNEEYKDEIIISMQSI